MLRDRPITYVITLGAVGNSWRRFFRSLSPFPPRVVSWVNERFRTTRRLQGLPAYSCLPRSPSDISSSSSSSSSHHHHLKHKLRCSASLAGHRTFASYPWLTAQQDTRPSPHTAWQRRRTCNCVGKSRPLNASCEPEVAVWASQRKSRCVRNAPPRSRRGEP